MFLATHECREQGTSTLNKLRHKVKFQIAQSSQSTLSGIGKERNMFHQGCNSAENAEGKISNKALLLLWSKKELISN
jgi:hypothetical protein